MNPLWQDFLAHQGAAFDGTGITDFGDSKAELQAAAQGDVMADLSHLGMIKVGGDDASAFLQGQLTNDVKLLDGSSGQYAGYCTAKGRLLAVFLAYAHHGHFHLQLNGGLRVVIQKRLKMYVLRSKVTIDDVTDSIVRIGVSGNGTPAALRTAFSDIPQSPLQLVSLEKADIVRLPGSLPRFEIFSGPEFAQQVWDALRPTCTPVGTAAWDWLEIRAGIPDITPATQEAFVPQMVNLDALGGISFKKGCYTGQEIVARTHYLGKVKRRTQLAHTDLAELPVPGDLIYGADSSEPVGMVVKAAAAPGGGSDLLAEARLESLQAGPLRCHAPDGSQLSVLPLPYAMD